MCVYLIPSLEEPRIRTKRMKTENISEDMETENTNGNEENVGTDKGILKGGLKKLFCKRLHAEYKYGAFAASHEINCASVNRYIYIYMYIQYTYLFQST